MARITIEINDSISDKIEYKIKKIDSAAKSAHESVKELGNYLSNLNAKGLAGLETSISALTEQIKKANTAQEKLVTQSALSAKQSDKLALSVQKVAVAEERANQERLKTQIQQERLTQLVDRGNDALERRINKLDRVSEAEKKAAIEAEKRYQIEIKSAYGVIRTSGVTERGIGRSGVTEAVALKTVRASEEQSKAEKNIADNVQRQLSLKVAINNIKDLNSAQAKVEAEKRVAENIERQFRAKVAINNLRQSDTARQALGGGGRGAVGTGGGGGLFGGGGASSSDEILRNNGAIGKSIDLYRTFGTILRTIRLAEYARDLAISTDTYTLINNRLKLVTSSLEESKQLYGDLLSIAQETRAPIEELAKSFVRFDYALKPLGATQRESLQFTKTFSQQLAISGLAVQEQTSVLLQMSQALNKGKLDGDEFRTVMETLPTVATAIAKEMGVARGELIRLAPEGKITATVIRNAMASIADETDKAFSQLTPTIGQSFIVMKNSVIDAIGKINEVTGASSAIANSIIFLAKNFELLGLAVVTTSTILAVRYQAEIYKTIVANGALIASNAKVAASFLIKNPIVGVATAIAYLGYEAVQHLKITNEQNKATDLLNAKLDLEEQKRRKGITTLRELSQAQSEFYNLGEKSKEVYKDTITALTEYINAEENVLTRHSRNLKAQTVSNLFDSEIEKLKDFQAKDLMFRNLFKDEIIELEKQKENALFKIKNPQESKDIDEARKKEKNLIQDLNRETEEYNSVVNTASNALSLQKITLDQYNKAIENTALGQKKLRLEEEISFKANKDNFEYMLVQVREAESKRIKFVEDNPQVFDNVKKTIDDIKNHTVRAEEEIASRRAKYNEERILAEQQIREESDQTSQAILKNIEERQRKEALDIIEKVGTAKEASRQSENVVREPDAISSREDVYARQLEQLQRYKEQEVAIVGNSRSQMMEINDRYNALEKKATDSFEKDKNIIRAQAAAEALGATSQAFDALSQLARNREGESSKTAKVLFGISKALALSEAIVATAVAVANANKTENLALKTAQIAIAYATGTAQIATIVGTSLGEFADGGLVGGRGTGRSDSNYAKVSRGEYIVNAKSTQENIDVLDRINYGGSSTTNPNNSVYVENNNKSPTINIINNTNAKVSQVGYNPETNTLDMQIDYIEGKLAQRYADGNGKLAKAIDEKRTRGF